MECISLDELVLKNIFALNCETLSNFQKFFKGSSETLKIVPIISCKILCMVKG